MEKNPALMQVDASNFRALLQSLSLVIEEAPACRELRSLWRRAIDRGPSILERATAQDLALMQVDSSNFRASPQPPGLVIEEAVNTANTIDRAICILERATAQNLAFMQVDASHFKALCSR